MMLIDCYEYEERGEELKVPHYASAAAVCDGNLPYIMAICPYSQHYYIISSSYKENNKRDCKD